MSVSIQIEEVFMLAIGSVSGLCHASRMVAMEMTVNFHIQHSTVQDINQQTIIVQCAVSLIYMNS